MRCASFLTKGILMKIKFAIFVYSQFWTLLFMVLTSQCGYAHMKERIGAVASMVLVLSSIAIWGIGIIASCIIVGPEVRTEKKSSTNLSMMIVWMITNAIFGVFFVLQRLLTN